VPCTWTAVFFGGTQKVDTKRYWNKKDNPFARVRFVWRKLQPQATKGKAILFLAAITLLLIGLFFSADLASAEDNRIPKEPPAILHHSPDVNEAQVPINGVISVVWDRPMQPDTNFAVTGPEGFITGTFLYEPETLTVMFLPDKNLAPDTRYGVLVAGQTDMNRQVQQDAYQWNFNTVTPTSVSIVSFGPSDAAPNWLWTSWPWLMGIISILSLVGFLFVWNRRRLAALAN
jgi:hypothetical protein